MNHPIESKIATLVGQSERNFFAQRWTFHAIGYYAYCTTDLFYHLPFEDFSVFGGEFFKNLTKNINNIDIPTIVKEINKNLNFPYELLDICVKKYSEQIGKECGYFVIIKHGDLI